MEFYYTGVYEEGKIKEELKKLLENNEYVALCVVDKV